MNKEKVTGGSQYLKFGKSHYERNKEVYLAKNQKRRRENIKYIRDIKEKGKCVDCGIADWRVLDFDHIPGLIKICNISSPTMFSSSKNRIDMEIAKCVLRCANCHRIITLERAGVV